MNGLLGWIRSSLSGRITHGGEDELGLGKIVQISLGTLHFFKPLGRPILILFAVGLPLAPLAIYLAWTLTSVFSNGLLNARPLEPNQATLLFLDSELFVKREIESARGLDPSSMQQTARIAGYAEVDLRVIGSDAQESKDALKAKLAPHLAQLPRVLPAEISWQRGRVGRWELTPALTPDARLVLARHWLTALAIVLGCAAAGFFGLRRRSGALAAGVIVTLAAAPLGPFFLDATFGLLRGRPIQSATARFLHVDPAESVSELLLERRGMYADLLGQAAQATGLSSELESYTWDADAEPESDEASAAHSLPRIGALRAELSRARAVQRHALRAALERRQTLLDEIARAHPEALPVDLRSDVQTAWRPRISAQLTPDARRQLRGRIVLSVACAFLVLVPLGVALILYGLRLLQQVNQGLRVDLMTRLQALSLRHHAESHVGDAIYRLFQDSSVVLRIFFSVVLTPLFHLSFLPFSLFFLSFFSPWLSLGLLIVMVPMLWIGWSSSPDMRSAFRSSRETGSALTSRIQETLAAIKVIKAYGAEHAEQARFERHSEAAFAASYVARTRIAGLGIVLFLFSGTSLILSDTWLGLQAAAEHPTFLGALMVFVGFASWNLGAFTAARSRMRVGSRGVEQLLTTWARAQDQVVGMKRVLELLTLEPEVQNAPDAVLLKSVTQGVSYQGICFGYKDDRRVLSSVDLAAFPGMITAIVGPTGSGKSTLMSLLLRLYDPDAGSIQIDGRDLRGYEIESLRSRVGIALQQNLLFGTTIRENIRYAEPEASDEQVRAAARVACADEFIEALPHGYDTLLGERGTKLSSGQRQRLSIARAVIKDPLILVLDEPTAALDAVTELRVLERLTEWGQARVIFLITHRLSTIRRAQQIVYLKDGCVVETGSPADLMARPDGLYRRFVELEELPEPGGERLPVAVGA